MKVTKAINVTGIPEDVHRDFKAMCAKIGMPMNDVIICTVEVLVNTAESYGEDFVLDMLSTRSIQGAVAKRRKEDE